MPTRRGRKTTSWWSGIGTGTFSGSRPHLEIKGPDLWYCTGDLSFIRPNGDLIKLLDGFETDLGSIPGLARWHRKLTKGYYNVAYLFHDAEFVKKRAGLDHLSFKQTNLLCIEIIKTLQIKGFFGARYGGGAFVANLVFSGIESPIAKTLWNK
jgi:hypothetical protein